MGSAGDLRRGDGHQPSSTFPTIQDVARLLL